MRKCILVILVLSGIVAARDPVDAERAALRKKLTRLAKVRKSLASFQPQPALPTTPAIDMTTSKDLLPIAEVKKVPEPVTQQPAVNQLVSVEKSPTPVPQPAVAGPATPRPGIVVGTDVAPVHEVLNTSATDDLQGGNGTQEVSLGEIARRYRARKRQQLSSSH